MNQYELNTAIMEGELNEASDAYFSARKGASHAEVKCFEAGFKRAWELRNKNIQFSTHQASKTRLSEDRIREIFRNTFPNGPYLFTNDTLKFARAIEKWAEIPEGPTLSVPAKPQPLSFEELKQTDGYKNADFNGINALVWFKRGFKQAEKSYGIGKTK